ncbi:MAG: membrane protein insertase YidC [Gammaproteobacteria bacterium]|nr:membrane protein insertase YidC [Gammaproteobacteria bacterium]
MDLQRSLLIGVIGVLSFMLLTEWVAFKKQQVDTPAANVQPVSVDNAPDLPAVAAQENGTDDLPQVSTEQVTAVAPVADSTGNAISVKTDVLDVRIDLTGGEIFHVGLPQYHARLDAPGIPFLLLQRDERRLYVAQSGLIGPDGIDSGGRASFTAGASSYQLADTAERLQVDLHYVSDGEVDVIKRFTLRRGDYLVDVEYLVTNNSEQRWQANLFGQIKRDSSPDPSSENSSGMGMVPFLGTALTQPEKRFNKFDFEEMAEKPFKKQLPGGWIAMIQHYFLSAWIPDPDQTHTYNTRVTRNGFNIGGFVSPAMVIDPGQSGGFKASFYAGPKDQYRLKEISEYLDLSVDYGWLWWIAQPLFWLLIQIQSVVVNWGVSIILLTVLIKAAFFKLSATSYKSMANMRRVQPRMTDIRERYGDDKQKQSQAMMELYKKEKINPLGGCLPILVQMPVFISLYWVLMESVELRQAPFYLWIKDLSAMDPYFILPLIMGASMWFQMRLNPPPPDPMQAKVMQWMPVIFTFFFLWFPAGLVLYWVANNLLSIAQQWVITRQIEKAAEKS